MTVAVNKVYNYARMTTATTGTGTITLGSAVPPYLTFAQAGVSDGDVVYYSIVDGTSNVECGIGTYTAAGTTLSRTTVLRSSGAGNTGKITLSGSAEVHIEFLANAVSGFLAGPAQGPTYQVLTSGTSYTTPANCTFIEGRMIGGGGGGGGSGATTTAGSGGNGGNTTFNAGAITAPGGTGGSSNAATPPAVGGAGGTAGTGGTFSIAGGSGGSADRQIGNGSAGGGGNGAFGGGAGITSDDASSVAKAGAPNSGGGGAGGGSNGNGAVIGGGGGGSGAYTEFTINSPTASYTYAIGAAGTAGTAGTSGLAGGAGGSGMIIIKEFYN